MRRLRPSRIGELPRPARRDDDGAAGGITHGDYPAVADLLIAAGARLPARVAGSETVQDVLRRAGVPDPD
jgi:hypothetical protein